MSKYDFNPFTGNLDKVNNSANEINITDSGAYYTGTEVETALQEIGAGTTLDSRYLQISNNLSDVADVATARTNLGLVAGAAGDIWVEKAGDTMTGDLLLKPTSDSTTVLQVQQSDATVVFNVDTTNARVGIGTASPNDPLHVTTTSTETTGTQRALLLQQSIEPTGSFDTKLYGIEGLITINTSETYSGTVIAGLRGRVTCTNAVTADGLNIRGVSADIDVEDATSNNATTGWFQMPIVDGGSVSNAYGINIRQGTSGAGTISTLYGLRVESVTSGSTNYAIFTNEGLVEFRDQVKIDGRDAADIQLVVQGAASQSANLLEIQDSNAANLAEIDNVGFLGIGTNPSYPLHVLNDFTTTGKIIASYHQTSYDGDATAYGLYGLCMSDKHQDNSAKVVGVIAYGRQRSTKTIGRAVGGEFYADMGLNNRGNVTNMIGGEFSVLVSQENNSADNITAGKFQLTINEADSSAGTAKGIEVDVSNSGTITNLHGLFINNIDAASSTNRAITTGTGLVHFGDQVEIIGSAAADVQLTVKGAASQSGNLLELQESDGSIMLASGDGLGGSVFSGNQQLEDIDFVWAGDTEANLFRVDAGADATRMGDWDTNYVEVDKAGDMIFVGGAGLAFAEIYAADANNTITITTAGKANKVQITSFTNNGVSNNCTPDHTSDHITITKAMKYLCTVSIHLKSAAAGGSDTIGYSVYKNNGATEFANLHGQRDLSGGGGDEGSVSLSGIIDLAVNDTIEVWIWNVDSTDDIVIDDINLSLLGVGG
jgi:hypothetical protein